MIYFWKNNPFNWIYYPLNPIERGKIMEIFWLTLFVTILGIIAFTVVFFLSFRGIFKHWIGERIRILLTDTYLRNVWEIISSGSRYVAQNIVDTALRCENDEAISRTWGTTRKMSRFDGLMFLPAQLSVLPTKESIKIQTKTCIGPKAKRPLHLDIPLLISGMGVGVGISKKLKLAITKGAAAVGTASNTGEGPFWQEERKWAKKLILQYSRSKWAKDPKILKQADMIEIAVGNGASAGTPYIIDPQDLSTSMKQLMELNPGEPAMIHSRVPNIDDPSDWKELVTYLRKVTDGVPIGVKIVPARVEEDVRCAIEAGVDFITIDGAQAGVRESSPILQDDFGLPTLRGLVRAVQVLDEQNVRDQISIIVSGGLYSPGEYLKAIALGANAVALGTVILISAIHTQVTKVLPFEPISQLAWSSGKFADQLDVEKAAKHTANLLKSSIEEMKIATMCLGKKSIMEVSKEDLIALDPETSRLTGVPLAYQWRPSSQIQNQ
jgi:glutamate synthase domain-containing protein 2